VRARSQLAAAAAVIKKFTYNDWAGRDPVIIRSIMTECPCMMANGGRALANAAPTLPTTPV
jgi:hypothetical protein